MWTFSVGANDGGYVRLFVSQITGPLPILGDANQDGEVTFADIASFIEVLTAGIFSNKLIATKTVK